MKALVLTALILWSLPTSVWPSGAPQIVPETAVRFLTSDPGAIDYWPCVSPDGKTVLFSRTTANRKTWDLVVVPIAGGEPRGLASARLPVSATQASWSTRHHLIAFTGASSDGKNTVWLISADGRQPRQLASAGLSEQVFYLPGIRTKRRWRRWMPGMR